MWAALVLVLLPSSGRRAPAHYTRRTLGRRKKRVRVSWRVRNQHSDHAVLPRGDEELAVAAAADVEVGARDGRAVCRLDELAQRDICAIPPAVACVELDLFDGCDS